MILTAAATRYALAPDALATEAGEAAAAHRRAMLASLPFDVASSDRHTVKPWLAARLGFSPPTADLADQGFVLAGGRVDVISEKPVPTLVYRYHEHVISLVAIPASGAAAAPSPRSAGGLNAVTWTDAGYRYWALSDAEASVVARFVSAFRQATQGAVQAG
jgi:anti-sigma factor RsiW